MIGFGGTGSPKLCMQPEMIPQKFYLKRLFLSTEYEKPRDRKRPLGF